MNNVFFFFFLSLFTEEVKVFLWNNTLGLGSIRCLIEDPLNTSNYLIGGGDSVIVHLDTHTQTQTVLLGEFQNST